MDIINNTPAINNNDFILRKNELENKRNGSKVIITSNRAKNTDDLIINETIKD